MKIVFTCPALSPNGGIRVILDMAHELAKTHEVSLFCPEKVCNWYIIKIQINDSLDNLKDADYLIISSPHHIHLKDLKIKAKMFSYVQMMEHLFYPRNQAFKNRAFRWYRELPVITISEWGFQEIQKMNRNVSLIGNGVNFDHFPIYNKKKDGKVILLESPIPFNPTKDKFRIALKVSKRLESLGYTVKGYGAINCPDIEFYQSPDLKTLNKLYREATILVKATVYDFRSTSPLEAGAKGCVTVRAINQGDDDLIDGFNCLRVKYNEEDLYKASVRLLKDDNLRTSLAKNMIEYLKSNTWEVQAKKFTDIICA